MGPARAAKVSNSSRALGDAGATGRCSAEKIRGVRGLQAYTETGNIWELSFSTVTKGFRKARDGFTHVPTLRAPSVAVLAF